VRAITNKKAPSTAGSATGRGLGDAPTFAQARISEASSGPVKFCSLPDSLTSLLRGWVCLICTAHLRDYATWRALNPAVLRVAARLLMGATEAAGYR
jgi:hypothetical protein